MYHVNTTGQRDVALSVTRRLLSGDFGDATGLTEACFRIDMRFGTDMRSGMEVLVGPGVSRDRKKQSATLNIINNFATAVSLENRSQGGDTELRRWGSAAMFSYRDQGQAMRFIDALPPRTLSAA